MGMMRLSPPSSQSESEGDSCTHLSPAICLDSATQLCIWAEQLLDIRNPQQSRRREDESARRRGRRDGFAPVRDAAEMQLQFETESGCPSTVEISNE